MAIKIGVDINHRCNICGSRLVLVKSKKESIDNHKFPQTVSIYRCSSKECQDKINQLEKKRLAEHVARQNKAK